jgi:hypothetical protein
MGLTIINSYQYGTSEINQWLAGEIQLSYRINVQFFHKAANDGLYGEAFEFFKQR